MNGVDPPDLSLANVPMPDTDLRKNFSVAIYEMKRQGAGADHPKFGTLLSQVSTFA